MSAKDASGLFRDPRSLSERQRGNLLTKQTALRILSGSSTRTLSAEAAAVGISRQRLSKCCYRIAGKLGIRWALFSDEHREALARVQRAKWAKRKAAARGTAPNAPKQETERET